MNLTPTLVKKTKQLGNVTKTDKVIISIMKHKVDSPSGIHQLEVLNICPHYINLTDFRLNMAPTVMW